MKKGVIISVSVLGALGIGYLIYREIQKARFRMVLETELQKPRGSGGTVGGVDELLASEIFDPEVYKTRDKATITLVEARERAEVIYDNYSWYSDNEDAIIGAFNGLGHLDDVSKISDQFRIMYSEDLFYVIKKSLDSEEELDLLSGKLLNLPNN